MEKFELTILGCGSAKPTTRHLPSSQVLNVRDKLFMIDCGEGTQLQYCRNKLSFSRLNHIFISHLHGDHLFGLPGLISTFNLLGRTAELHVHSPKGLEQMMKPIMDYCNYDMSYQVFFHEFDTNQSAVIFEDRTLTVTTIPLKHRVPTCGFLFKEKEGLRHICHDMIDAYEIPMAYINNIKAGADFVLPDGEVITNDRLTSPAIDWKEAPSYGPVENLRWENDSLLWDSPGRVRFAVYAISENTSDASAERSTAGGILSTYLLQTCYTNSFRIPETYLSNYRFAVSVVDRYGNEYQHAYVREESTGLIDIAGGTLDVKFENWELVTTTKADIDVYNTMGQRMMSEENCTALPLIGLPSGIYIVKAHNKNAQTIKKIYIR